MVNEQSHHEHIFANPDLKLPHPDGAQEHADRHTQSIYLLVIKIERCDCYV